MSIPRIEFPPLGTTVPQIGFGCARLVGRSSLRASTKIVEAALAAGIRYFDVAPSYGMGTAEDVVGAVIGNAPDVVVATKVGIPRPPYSARRDLVRRWTKPILDRSRAIKTFARRWYAPAPAASAGSRPERDFSEENLRVSIEESLRRLRRDRVDVYLAHEPVHRQLDGALAARFDGLRDSGLVGVYGVGVDVRSDRWAEFGQVWQSGWPGPSTGEYTGDVTHVYHGVIRFADKTSTGATVVPAPRLVREATLAAPGSVILVSTSTPARLRELLSEL